MYSRFMRIILPFFTFIFSFFIVSQLGKHFFFPFSYLSGIRIDYLAPTVYLIDILSLPLLFISILHLINRMKWVRFYLIFFIVINCIFALSKPLWFYSFARLAQCILLFIFFRYYGNRKDIYSSVIWGLLLGGCIELILSLSQLSARHSLQGWWYYLGERYFSIFTPSIAKAYFLGKELLRPYGTFSHPNSLGGFYLLVFVFVLTQKRITNQIIRGIFLFASSALVLISFSRTAIATYVLINFFYFFRTSPSCKLCLLAKSVIAFVLILFVSTISGDSNSFQKRTDFFEKSISIIAKYPFTGTGMGGYLIAQHSYPQKFSTFFEQPVHNIFLFIIAQLGIPLSLLIFTLFNQLIRVKIKSIAFFLPFLCVFITGNVDHYWITLQQNVLVLAVIFGILFSHEETTS